MPKVEIIQQKGFNFLWINGELIMWDIPAENKDQEKIAQQAFGEVLVAGYGLGIVQKYLTQNHKVTSLLTIELLPEVIKECQRVYGKTHGEIEISDFFHYKTNKKFDCVIGDVWADVSYECLDDYVKFKNKAEEIVKPQGKILAWGKDYLEFLLRNQ